MRFNLNQQDKTFSFKLKLRANKR